MGNYQPDLLSLVFYKGRPAMVKSVGEKLDIQLQDGEIVRVRPKDLVLLHPGPMKDLRDLQPQQGDVQVAWEILLESESGQGGLTLRELAEIIYGSDTPATAWETWCLVQDGLYFHGTPDSIQPHSKAHIDRERQLRQNRLEESCNWQAFLSRAHVGEFIDQDQKYLEEVEALALASRQESRVLRELGRSERPETAHALLVNLGYWDITHDPYPARLSVPVKSPEKEIPQLSDVPRKDLTQLEAWAIDDQGNQDPDDAISLEGERLWVHVADVSALVFPDSPLDLEARARGSSLYLPTGTVHMLPADAIQILGLGLSEISPALSFGINLDPQGEISDSEIILSWVRVSRLSYETVEDQMDSPRFFEMYQIAQRYQERRRRNGAVFIDLPEIMIRTGVDNQVKIRTVANVRSRMMVEEAMLMAGETAAHYALQNKLPFPFSVQEATNRVISVDREVLPGTPYGDLARAFALRRIQNKSQVSSLVGAHAGVGLAHYARVTSPLRRYLDLVAHQQLRASLVGNPLLDDQAVLERIGACEAATDLVNQAERLSRRHWALVYLLQNPGWRGAAVLVDRRGPWGRFILPELALETQVHLGHDLPLNSTVEMQLKQVDLPELEAYFDLCMP